MQTADFSASDADQGRDLRPAGGHGNPNPNPNCLTCRMAWA